MTTIHATEPADEVVAAQRAWSHAILSNDADTIAELMRKDWVIVTPAGPITADPFLGAIRAGVLSHSKMQPASSQDGTPRVRVYGDVAALTQRFVSIETNDGTTRANDEWMTTIFTRTDAGWLVSLIHLTPAASPAES